MRLLIVLVFISGLTLVASSFGRASGQSGSYQVQVQTAGQIEASTPRMQACPDSQGRFVLGCPDGTITWSAPEGFSRISLVNITGAEPRLISRPDTIYTKPKGCVREIQVAMGLPVPDRDGRPTNLGLQDTQANLLVDSYRLVVYRQPAPVGVMLHSFKRISADRWLELYLSSPQVSRKSAVAEIASPFMLKTSQVTSSQRSLMRRPQPGPCRQLSPDGVRRQLLGIASNMSYRGN